MASQAKPKSESALRFLRNPLKLLKQKEPIVLAMGHVFNAELSCTHCGRPWSEQREQPSRCGAAEESTPAAKDDTAEDV
jgi:hypothetical protein